MQFDTVKNEAGANRFVMTPTKWIEQNIEQPKRLELLRATAIKQLRTIMGLDFTSQKILSISEKNEE